MLSDKSYQVGHLVKTVTCLAVMTLMLEGCSGPGQEKPSFFMRTSLVVLNADEFQDELELKRAAYPYNLSEDPEKYNEMVIDLVQELSDELVLLSAAAASNVSVSQSELDGAVADFKKDYPDDSFKQALLTNAVSYPLWLKRFKTNMIIDKFIQQHLKKNVEISAADIKNFYADSQSGKASLLFDGTDKKPISDGNDEDKLIKRLRLKKAQASYDDWMRHLTEQYPVEIDRGKLRSILVKKSKNIKTLKETEDET